MSEEVWKEIGFFGLIIGAIFAFWLFTGGPQRASSDKGVFIQPLPPAGSGNIYGSKPIQYRSIATTTIKVPVVKSTTP
jgi:hypothetical protein